MRVKDLKKITSRYTNGRTGNTWFRIQSIHKGKIKWWCTHGGWQLTTDLQGRYQLGEIKINIEEVYTKDQYMGLFGKDNPYE